MSDGLSEVLTLTAALADQVHAAHTEGRRVPDEQTVALIKAARLLRERGVEWPPSLASALRDLAGDFGQDTGEIAPDGGAEGDDATDGRLARLLSALRWGKAQP